MMTIKLINLIRFKKVPNSYSSINIDFSSNNGGLCADAESFGVASVD